VRSRADFACFAALALLCAAPAWSATTAAAPTRAEVERAVVMVKADPNLATEKKGYRLVWDETEKPRERTQTGNWARWLGDLFRWLAEGSAVIVWVLLAGLAALLVIFIARVVMQNRMPERNRRFIAPTHVQDLDIRPESLPPDIGAAARALWDRGEQRAALALLYRGLLSRLAHGYEVPIRDSSTEGDCLVLAARKLDAARVVYVTQLIRIWQQAIYGGVSIETAQVWELCAQFARHMDGPAAPGTPRPAAYAGGAAA